MVMIKPIFVNWLSVEKSIHFFYCLLSRSQLMYGKTKNDVKVVLPTVTILLTHNETRNSEKVDYKNSTPYFVHQITITDNKAFKLWS